MVNVNAPVFVPKASFDASSPPASKLTGVPTPTPPPVAYAENGHNGVDALAEQVQDLSIYDDAYTQGYDHGYYNPAPVMPSYVIQPLDYHLYTHPIPPNFVPSSTDIHFVPASTTLRETLQARSEATRATGPPGLQLPEELQGYHTLVPLESITPSNDRRKFGNWFSSLYKAVNVTDGGTYALRRIENYRMTQQAAFAPIEAWSRLRHPNVVSVREAFTTRAFNDNSLVIAYSYHANARTLFDVHLASKGSQHSHTPHQQWFSPGRHSHRNHANQNNHNRIPERTLWSYVLQLASALKKVHEAGLAVRTLEPQKILLTGRNRIRINSCGLTDVLVYEMNQDITVPQQEDFIKFGGLLLMLGCSNIAAPLNMPNSLEIIERAYGADLKNLIVFLLGKPGQHKLRQLFELIGSRIITEMDDSQDAVDRLEGELMSELENARLVRLLAKFGFINERPEFARDPRWSETGDRYILKLFRDYLFHQVDEFGNPVVSLSHVLTCLNKLDAGVEEKIMLVARDEQSCLVVSYKEIKSCMEAAFK
ncbi:hypothetical protein ONZ45_g6391 [Pleurotus djamor]|nr:hypothetical protein ONZ45_g6391 [Pleurotus djamor]